MEDEAKIIEAIVKSIIHPLVVKTALYDRHVDNRLPILVEIERIFEKKYEHSLFIQCDVESKVVTYDVDTAGLSVTCPW